MASEIEKVVFGNTEIDKVYYGNVEIDKIYYGNDLIYTAKLDLDALKQNENSDKNS